MERIEVLYARGGFKVGTTWRATRVSSGRAASEQLIVTLCEPPARFLVESRNKASHQRTEFLFSPQDAASTLVRMLFAVEAHGVGKVVGVVLGSKRGRSLTKVLQQDLDDLAVAAEAR